MQYTKIRVFFNHFILTYAQIPQVTQCVLGLNLINKKKKKMLTLLNDSFCYSFRNRKSQITF